MRIGITDEGLRFAVQRAGKAVACAAVSISCGTRDEEGFPAGIAHFTEHTIFRGTSKRSAYAINSCLDRLGGELNAYTTKEETVIHATFLKEDLSKALGLLMDLSTDAVFPDDEIATEKGVVIDEIISSRDNPSDDIYDSFEKYLFEGTALETPILGSVSSVKKIKASDLRRFVKANYTPDRMVLSIVADIDESLLEKRVRRISSKYFPYPATASFREHTAPVEAHRFEKVVNKRNHEVNAVIGCIAPSLYDMPERLTAAFLANILGGPASNSLLNASLREKNGWVYGIECVYTQYADTGVMAISFGCDKPNLDNCLGAVRSVLDSLMEKPLSERRLASFRRQILGQLAVSGESSEARCLSMGKSMLSWGRIMTPDETKEALDSITPEEILSLSRRLFAKENLSSLIYL